MKKLLSVLALAALVASTAASAAGHYVNPYTRSNGTYVQGHMQTAPNSTRLDNYSTRGNVNPYTGQAGTVSPQYTPPQRSAPSPYGGGQRSPNGEN